MGQRVFRSDDSSPWVYGYGTGSAGDSTISANTVDDATRTPKTTISATINTFSATVGSFSGFADGDLVLIHQSREGGDGAPYYELNRISSHSGINVTFTLVLTHNYDTKAQMVKLTQFNNFTVNGSVNLTAQSWDHNVGGILPIFALTSITIPGSVICDSCGFIPNSGGNPAYQGEGTGGAGSQSRGANGDGGGGAAGVGDGGGGGANANAGSVGGGGSPGNGGNAAGSADLVTMAFGGAGGSGSANGANNGQAGGKGGGILLLIAPTITITGNFSLSGQSLGSHSGHEGSGGGGAGGSALLKGKVISIGSSCTASAGTGGADDGGGGHAGGNGSVGRIHVDYAKSFSGSSTTGIDSRQDPFLAGSSNALAFGQL